ncbi:MAG TPA: hypothetical protein VHS05_06660 [Pyrinomonadaceae bacterium]|nr:hypothetical protein [Pyrinomonadaceae bacterium]
MTNKHKLPLSHPKDIYYWCTLGAVSILLCLPVLSVTYVPLVDYPNHLARVHILYQYADVSAYPSTYYRVLEPIPNLAIDLIVPLMLPFIDILAAGKIFLVLTILLFVTGCHQLGKTIHGRPTWLVLPCLFFFYNSMLLYGFVNYMVGMGLFCVTVACRLKLRNEWTERRLLTLTLLSLLAFIAHLSAYAFLGVTFVVVTAWDYFTGKEKLYRSALSLTPLLVPLACFVVFMKGTGTIGHIEWNTMSGKLIGMLALTLSYKYTLDLLLVGGFLGIFIVLVTRIQSLQVDPAIFTSGTVFAILYLLSPKVLFGSSAADVRFILPAALLLTLSLKVSILPHTKKVLLSLFVLLASVRVVCIWRTWVSLNEGIATDVEDLKKLPVGARVYPIFVLPEDRQAQKVERSLNHVVHYATIYRHAFVPTLFAYEGQQPLLFRATPPYIGPDQWQTEQWVQHSDEWIPLLANYDYVWAHRADGSLEELLHTRCTKINETGAFSLWRVDQHQ